MSTKSYDLLGVSPRVMSGSEGVSSSYSVGAKLCIHPVTDTSTFSREMVSLFLREG